MKHVTDILAECGFYQGFDRVPKKKRRFYMNRGKQIHVATAMLDRDELDWDSLDPRIVSHIEAYVRFRQETQAKPLEIELAVQNDDLGYCGTLDRIYDKSALWPTGRLLVDIKTTEADEYTRLQTMAYAMAYGKPIKRGFVALRKDGTYRAGVYDEDEVDKAGWMACLQLVNWKERRGTVINDRRTDDD